MLPRHVRSSRRERRWRCPGDEGEARCTGRRVGSDRAIGVPGDVRDAEHNQVGRGRGGAVGWAGHGDCQRRNRSLWRGPRSGRRAIAPRWSRRLLGSSGRWAGCADCARKATAVTSSSSPPSPASVAERTRRSTRGQSTPRSAWAAPSTGNFAAKASGTRWYARPGRPPSSRSGTGRRGRIFGSESYLRPEDVAHAIHVLRAATLGANHRLAAVEHGKQSSRCPPVISHEQFRLSATAESTPWTCGIDIFRLDQHGGKVIDHGLIPPHDGPPASAGMRYTKVFARLAAREASTARLFSDTSSWRGTARCRRLKVIR